MEELDHPEQIFLSADKTLRAVLNDRKGILSLFITSTSECIWSGQDDLFLNARTCHFNVEGNTIEFTSKNNEGWTFDIKTKTCTNILNDKLEQINNNNTNNNNSNGENNHGRQVYKRKNNDQSNTKPRISNITQPRRPGKSSRRPKSASHARGNNSNKASNKRAATPVNNNSGVGSRRRVVHRPGTANTTRRRFKRPSSAKPRIPSRDNNKRKNKKVQRGDSYSWLKGENNNSNNISSQYGVGEMPARLLTANGSILHVYGGSSNVNSNNNHRNSNSGGINNRTPRSKSMHNISGGGRTPRSRRKRKGPWDKMEKEEQYMKLIQLKRIATKAEEELKLMKTKVARLERQAKKKDEQVETTLGKAAAAITAALTREAGGDNGNGGHGNNNNNAPSIVDTSNAKLVARLQRQVYALTDNLKKKNKELHDLKREQRGVKLKETLIELEECKLEVTRLKEMLDYRVNSPPSIGNNNLENGMDRDANGYVNEFKDTIRVLKVQRTHVLKENQRLTDLVHELQDTLASRINNKKNGVKKKKSTQYSASRIKNRTSKISKKKKNSNRKNNNTLPWLTKIIQSLQSVAAERKVPYAVAVDDLQALLVICEEPTNDNNNNDNIDGSTISANNSLVSVNGLLQSLQTLDHNISPNDIQNLIHELNISSNISNELIYYNILLDCLMDPPIDNFNPHDLRTTQNAHATNSDNHYLNEELEAIVRAQQEQLRVQNAQVSTLDATVRRLELQNKKLNLEMKEKELEMPLSPERKPITENTNMIITVNSTMMHESDNIMNDTIKTATTSSSIRNSSSNKKMKKKNKSSILKQSHHHTTTTTTSSSSSNNNNNNKNNVNDIQTSRPVSSIGHSRRGRKQNASKVNTTKKLKFSPQPPPSKMKTQEASTTRNNVESPVEKEYLEDHQAVLNRRRALLEKRRKLESDVIQQSEKRRQDRLQAMKAEKEDDDRRKTIAKEMENSLRENGHDMTSVGTPLGSQQTNVNFSTGVENNEKDTSKKKEKKNGEPVRLTAIEAMKVAASNQREEEEKKLMLAMQSQDNFDNQFVEKNSPNMIRGTHLSNNNNNIEMDEKKLDAKLKELLKQAIASGSFAQEASKIENNGTISLEHLKTSIDMVKGVEEINAAQIDWFVHKLDVNGDQSVDYRELLYFVYGTEILPESAKTRGSSNNNNTKHTDDNKKEADEEIENNASPKNNNNLTERQKQVELEFRVSATATKLKKIFIEVINSGNASDFREIFEIIDDDRSGTVTRGEFAKVLNDIDFKISKDVENSLLSRFDKDGNGTINYRAFLRFCTDSASIQHSDLGISMQAAEKVRKALRRIINENEDGDHMNNFSNDDGLKNVQSLFNGMDKDGEGTIDITEFREAMMRWGTGLTESEINIFGERFDYDGDGEVDYNEFLRFIFNDRQDVRWNGDMTTVRKLRKNYARAVSMDCEKDFEVAFKRYDFNDNGLITKEEFRSVLNDTWLELSDNDIDDILRRFEAEKSGKISYPVFINLCGGNLRVKHNDSSDSESNSSSSNDTFEAENYDNDQFESENQVQVAKVDVNKFTQSIEKIALHYAKHTYNESMTNLPEMNAIQKALDEIFKSFDFDGSGTVDKDDFLQCLLAMRIPASQANSFLKEIDLNDNQIIEYEEFVTVISKHVNSSARTRKVESEQKEEVMDIIEEEEMKKKTKKMVVKEGKKKAETVIEEKDDDEQELLMLQQELKKLENLELKDDDSDDAMINPKNKEEAEIQRLEKMISNFEKDDALEDLEDVNYFNDNENGDLDYDDDFEDSDREYADDFE